MENRLQVSVSGIRGIYPETLTSDVVFTFGVAFGSYVKTKRVFVCRDTRVSGDSLKNSMITGLLCTGKDVVDLGIAPTPEIGYIIEKIEPSSGVVITASHNPQDYNGIKFFSDKGAVLNADEGKKLLDVYHKRFFIVSKTPGFISSADYTEQYFNAIYRTVDLERIRKRRFRVVVDVCQGVGSFFTERFLKEMGCDVIVMNKEPAGFFSHNPEPVPENLKDLAGKVVEEKADAGFAQDPDCDRLAFVCENGMIPGEELTLVLSIKNILEREGSNKPIVVNLSTTALVEEIAKGFGIDVCRTKIGEINVIEKMRENGSIIGGEGNGGVIFPAVHYGRDSFVGMALILEYLARTGKKVSELIGQMPKYFILKRKIRISEEQKNIMLEDIKRRYSAEENVNLEDGVKIIRKNGWIHIRPSGTEPVIRLYVEGKNREIAERYLSEFTSYFPSP